MPANETRGELSLTFEDVEYILRPSYEAIVAFETETGQSSMQLYRAALDGSLDIASMAIIVRECIRAWGRATENRSAIGVNERRLGELIIEDGPVLIVLKKIELLLFMVITGGMTSSGEAKPATMTTTEVSTSGAGSVGSPAPRSGGARPSSGPRRRASSGQAGRHGAN